MIDLTMVKTYEVLPSLAELHELNLKLKTTNKNLKGWLIGTGIILGIGIAIVILNKNKNNAKTKERNK